MKTLKLWLPVVLWAGLIFYFSGIPHLSSGLEIDYLLRKLAHVFEYCVLTILLRRALKGSFNLAGVFLLFCSVGGALLYALSDECHQMFVPGRGGSLMDVLIDSIGVLAACLILGRVIPRQR